MVGEEFLDRLDFFNSSWLPAREVVMEAVKERYQVTGLCVVLVVLILQCLSNRMLLVSHILLCELKRFNTGINGQQNLLFDVYDELVNFCKDHVLAFRLIFCLFVSFGSVLKYVGLSLLC